MRETPLNWEALTVISEICGWAYFFAWSFSFYPQVRFSDVILQCMMFVITVLVQLETVVGLSFDFELFNITGFLGYTIYNVCLFWVKEVQNEYINKHGPPIPVKLPDVIFSIHGAALVAFTLFQRGPQRFSLFAIVTNSLLWLSGGVLTGFCPASLVSWLTLVYYFSYVKVFVTFIKYAPQAWLNFRRKCTVGWNIYNVILDFSGGALSFIQMFIDGINTANWSAFYGDPAKLGLSVVSMAFDVLFLVQHYILYWGTCPPEQKTKIIESSVIHSVVDEDIDEDAEKAPLLAFLPDGE